MAELSDLQLAASFIEKHGLPHGARIGATTRAILAAHAAEPSDHERARENAQLLLDADGFSKQLTGYHPCIVFGVKAAKKYFVEEKRLHVLAPFVPTCMSHGDNYDGCREQCVYGVKLEGLWVHDQIGPLA